MAILSQDIADSLRFALDAEGADHYDDTLDIIPAINLSVKWLVSVINRTLGNRKLGEEILRELTEARVFSVDGDSRVLIGDPTQTTYTPEEIWSILAVYPNPVVGDTQQGSVDAGELSDPKISVHRTDKYHRSSDKSAKRLTVEEWTVNRKNPFEAGNDLESACSELNEYAYLYPVAYWNGHSANPDAALEIRPKLGLSELVTIVYVKVPKEVTSLTDVIEFPNSVFDLLFNKSLQYIAYKQGDGTTAFTASQNDIQLLLNTVL